jgi:hypothetical protein
MYMLIQNHNNPLSIIRACSSLGVSRSGYNAWLKRPQSEISDPSEMELKDEIQKIAVEFPRYGLRLKGKSTCDWTNLAF